MRPESKTAFFVCGARMVDAQSNNPVCNDTYAERFMKGEAREIFDIYRPYEDAMISNTTRHRIMDDMIRARLDDNPDQVCIIIGAGCDSRAYRMNGGIWIEFDVPEIIEYKNQILPVAECKNQVTRIPFESNYTLPERLSEICTDRPAIIVVEGVFIYLYRDAIMKMIQDITARFPAHVLLCDLLSVSCVRLLNLKLNKFLREFGSELRAPSNMPEDIFTAFGYRVRQKISIPVKIAEYAELTLKQRLTTFALNTVLKNVRDGYSVFAFEYGDMIGVNDSAGLPDARERTYPVW